MAAFTATSAFLGTPDFNVIDIDPAQVAQGLQVYLERGSKLTGVSLDDISRSVISVPDKPNSVTLTELLSLGMKLFDAIVWLSAGRPNSHPLQADPAMKKDSIAGAHEIAKAVFYVYFFLLTQARYPVISARGDAPAVAKFLTNVMGMTESQDHYIRLICSFNPQLFDAKWIRYVQFAGLGQEAMSRFGLGVAGYRMFGPFKAYKIRDGLSTELQNAAKFAQNVAISQPTWDIHPVTRAPAVLTKRGNLNKNLSNLILDVFTTEQINEMVEAKMLYAMPKREPNYKNYLTWAEIDNISGPNQIFLAT